MKKYTTTIALLLTLGVFAFLTHSTSEAQEKSDISRLTEVLLELTNSQNNKYSASQEDLSLQNSTVEIALSWCNETPPSTPSSFHYKENADWDTSLMAKLPSGYIANNFMDLNGDGLLDYIWYEKRPSLSYTTIDGKGIRVQSGCVALNNGRGWDLVYKCIVSSKRNDAGDIYAYFYGDCADTSTP